MGGSKNCLAKSAVCLDWCTRQYITLAVHLPLRRQFSTQTARIVVGVATSLSPWVPESVPPTETASRRSSSEWVRVSRKWWPFRSRRTKIVRVSDTFLVSLHPESVIIEEVKPEFATLSERRNPDLSIYESLGMRVYTCMNTIMSDIEILISSITVINAHSYIILYYNISFLRSCYWSVVNRNHEPNGIGRSSYMHMCM